MEEQRIKASGFVVQPRLKFKHLRDQMIYQYLVSKANYRKESSLHIGQTKIILSEIEREVGWSRKMTSNSLKRLKELGYITYERMTQNRGILVAISMYEQFQDLENYSKNKQKKEQGKAQEEEQQKAQEKRVEKSCDSKVKPLEENGKAQEKAQEEEQQKAQLISITAFINSISNINKTLKEYIADAPVKNKNLSTTEEIESFVDFALRTNSLPTGVSKKILISYFDCIRLTRQTCTISANILANLIDKMDKYSVDQLHYAMWKHCEQHEDKREQYTLGILRNTDVHDAKRGLMKLKNKGVAHYAKPSQYPAAVGESTSSTSKEVERLEAIARERGLLGTIRDVELDF